MTDTLYYIHDPMCSWCYAFDNSLRRLAQGLPETVTVVKVVGGLAPDSAEPMPEDLRDKIRSTWQRIEQSVPGVRFNFDFWRKNTPYRSTYLACRAILAAKSQAPEFEDKMIEAIQHAYYRRAENPSLSATLIRCAQHAGLDMAAFERDIVNPAIEKALRDDIGLARKLGVVSFPSLRLASGGAFYPIRIDYLNPSAMLQSITAVIEGNRSETEWSL
ncbi:MAG: DsbA family protein [Gammaproteobacteria bacterium]